MSSQSSTALSTGSMRKIGVEYQSKMFFLPFADKAEEEFLNISHEELKARMFEYITNDVILNVAVYKHQLFSWQRTEGLLYHAFVVLETKRWFWSVEKNGEGIFVQRSKHRSAVREHLQHKERPPITQVICDSSEMFLKEFVGMLWKTNAVTSGYHYLWNNCKHFAKTVFDNVAKTKHW